MLLLIQTSWVLTWVTWAYMRKKHQLPPSLALTFKYWMGYCVPSEWFNFWTNVLLCDVRLTDDITQKTLTQNETNNYFSLQSTLHYSSILDAAGPHFVCRCGAKKNMICHNNPKCVHVELKQAGLHWGNSWKRTFKEKTQMAPCTSPAQYSI